MIRKTLIALAIGLATVSGAAVAASTVDSARAGAARKVVQLDGDVVVVSLVAAAGQSVANNVAVERYDASGKRVAWAKDGTWTDAGRGSIVFPNSAWHFTAIRDVQVFKDHVWILADSSTTGADGIAKPTTDLIAFSTDGEFKGGRFNVIRPQPERDVIGAGLVFKAATASGLADELTVVATCPEAGAVGGDRLCLQRYEVWSKDDWYPSFAGKAHDEVQWNLNTALVD